MTRLFSIIGIIILALGGGFIGAKLATPSATGVTEVKETAYERVLRTNTLRCGYGSWEPAVYKNTDNEMEGLIVELMNEVGKLAKINVEFVAEVDWGQIPESLKTGKIDAFCSGMWADGHRGKRLGYLEPFYFMKADVLVRADDERFPADGSTIPASSLNNPAYSMAATDGDVLETIIETEFPQVTHVPLPPLGTPADNLQHVLTGKTDFLVFPVLMKQQYEAANGPGDLKLLHTKPPLRMFPATIAVDIHEGELRRMLNAAVIELVNSGSYSRILGPYQERFPGAFIPRARMYQE